MTTSQWLDKWGPIILGSALAAVVAWMLLLLAVMATHTAGQMVGVWK